MPAPIDPQTPQTQKAPLPESATGTQYIGRFRTVQRLASNRVWDTFCARPQGLNGPARVFAIKALTQDTGSLPAGATERFLAAARRTLQLRDTRIARVIEVSEADGRAYLVTELVSGVPLDALKTGVQGQELLKHPLWFPMLAHLGAEIAKALAFAHNQKPPMVHGHLTPGNLRLTLRGGIKVCDFGLACSVAGVDAEPADDIALLGYRLLDTALGEAIPDGADLEPLFARLPQAFATALRALVQPSPPDAHAAGALLQAAIGPVSDLELKATLAGLVRRLVQSAQGGLTDDQAFPDGNTPPPRSQHGRPATLTGGKPPPSKHGNTPAPSVPERVPTMTGAGAKTPAPKLQANPLAPSSNTPTPLAAPARTPTQTGARTPAPIVAPAPQPAVTPAREPTAMDLPRAAQRDREDFAQETTRADERASAAALMAMRSMTPAVLSMYDAQEPLEEELEADDVLSEESQGGESTTPTALPMELLMQQRRDRLAFGQSDNAGSDAGDGSAHGQVNAIFRSDLARDDLSLSLTPVRPAAGPGDSIDGATVVQKFEDFADESANQFFAEGFDNEPTDERSRKALAEAAAIKENAEKAAAMLAVAPKRTPRWRVSLMTALLVVLVAGIGKGAMSYLDARKPVPAAPAPVVSVTVAPPPPSQPPVLVPATTTVSTLPPAPGSLATGEALPPAAAGAREKPLLVLQDAGAVGAVPAAESDAQAATSTLLAAGGAPATAPAVIPVPAAPGLPDGQIAAVAPGSATPPAGAAATVPGTVPPSPAPAAGAPTTAAAGNTEPAEEAAPAVPELKMGTPVVVSISSTPPGAVVYIGGKERGKTPMRLRARAASSEIVMVMPGYQLLREEHVLGSEPKLERTLTEAEAPASGEANVRIICRHKNKFPVMVDGRETGLLCPADPLSLAPGPHDIAITDLAKNETVIQHVNLKPGTQVVLFAK